MVRKSKFLMLLTIIITMVIEATRADITDALVEDVFLVLEPGQTVEGRILHEREAGSYLECAIMSFHQQGCRFQFWTPSYKKCVLVGSGSSQQWTVGSIEGSKVHTLDQCARNSCKNGGTCVDGLASYSCNCVTGYNGTNCQSNIDECASSPCQNNSTCTDGVNSYTCTCASGFGGARCNRAWIAPSNWQAVDAPVFYNGFEDTMGFTLHGLFTGPTLATGHVGSFAIKTDKANKEWIDFGASATASCFVMGNCTNSGSLSVWIRVTNATFKNGLITSSDGTGTSFYIDISINIRLRSLLHLNNGYFSLAPTLPSGWFHCVFVYDSGAHTYKMYLDGDLAETGSWTSRKFSGGIGNLMIGGRHTDMTDSDLFSSVQLDELAFFNRPLITQEMIDLYNQYK